MARSSDPPDKRRLPPSSFETSTIHGVETWCGQSRLRRFSWVRGEKNVLKNVHGLGHAEGSKPLELRGDCPSNNNPATKKFSRKRKWELFPPRRDVRTPVFLSQCVVDPFRTRMRGIDSSNVAFVPGSWPLVVKLEPWRRAQPRVALMASEQ